MSAEPEALVDEEVGATAGTGAPSRRPLVVLGVLGVVGVAGILFQEFASQRVAAPKVENADDSPALVPDHDGPSKLESPIEDAGEMPALEMAADPLAAPELADPLSDQLAAPMGGNVQRRLEKLQEEQLLKHMLEVQQQQLELRKKALVAPSAVREYGEAMREQAAQTAELMRGLEGQRTSDEEGAFNEMMGPLQALAQARGAGAAGGGGGSGASGGESGRDPNVEKREFFARGGTQLQPGTLEHEVAPQQTPYELQMGDVIPGILISGINSEAPGQIVAQVSENVCDSATGNHLLIPQGSRLVGTYSAAISQGQARVQVAWVRLRMPNGDKLDLGGMSGADQRGVAGFTDRVNRHFTKRLAAALMASAFTVAYELTAPRTGSFYGSAVHRGVGENIVNLGTDMAREEGRLPPTLEIRPGYRFAIMVQKDIVFRRPYVSGKRSGRC